jgi:hypothetical protein
MKTKNFSLLDVFLVLLIILASLAFYFSFIHPIQFSHSIKREGVLRYAEVEVLLPDDLGWMKDVIQPGEESRDVYKKLEWQILAAGEETLGGKKIAKLTVKLLLVEMSSGILDYGKYTVVRGGRIVLINDRYFIEGRIYNFRLLEERVAS